MFYVAHMSVKGFIRDLFATETEKRPFSAVDSVTPLPRTAAYDPLTLSTVFRGVQILQTALAGLPIRELKNGYALPTVAPIIMQPDSRRSRRDFISDTVASLAIDGNAFYRIIRAGSQIVSLDVLPPSYVTVNNLTADPAAPIMQYSYLGKNYTGDDIIHLKFLNIPGRLRGLGPISAAREEVMGAKDARDYKARWYSDGSHPSGILATDKPISPEQAQQAKEAFSHGGGSEVKVLGNNLKYSPIMLSPADMQFLETQKFDTTQIARLLGIPASLMLAAVDGSNLTYSNIEQSWIEFADYTLNAYAGEIEEALNMALPRGHTAAFDWDSSRRSNTSDRFNAYATAISSGLMTVDEARAKEGLKPLNEEE